MGCASWWGLTYSQISFAPALASNDYRPSEFL